MGDKPSLRRAHGYYSCGDVDHGGLHYATRLRKGFHDESPLTFYLKFPKIHDNSKSLETSATPMYHMGFPIKSIKIFPKFPLEKFFLNFVIKNF